MPNVPEPAAPSYAAAVEELEGILRTLDRPDVDVDLLTTHVARAAELIAFCRERLTAAAVDVERIVATLPGSTAGVDVDAGTLPGDDQHPG